MKSGGNDAMHDVSGTVSPASAAYNDTSGGVDLEGGMRCKAGT